MKAVIVLALVAIPAPALADPAVAGAASAPSERKICTRIERQSGSRLSYRRVCLTQTEWRDRLGADWRQRLAGGISVEDDMDAIETRSREFSNMPSQAAPQ